MVSILLAVAVPIQDSFSLLAHAYPSYPKGSRSAEQRSKVLNSLGSVLIPAAQHTS